MKYKNDRQSARAKALRLHWQPAETSGRVNVAKILNEDGPIRAAPSQIPPGRGLHMSPDGSLSQRLSI